MGYDRKETKMDNETKGWGLVALGTTIVASLLGGLVYKIGGWEHVLGGLGIVAIIIFLSFIFTQGICLINKDEEEEDER